MTEREFNDAMDRHLDMVYRLALNWFRQPADAEDAAQEAMLRLWRAGETFTSDDHLRHWLVRVTLNVCKDISRSPWRRRTVPLESVCPPEFTVPEDRELYQAVMDLPANYRLPLYLYYFEGYTAGEVGQLLGVKESTVQTRLARARQKLKQQLTEE